MVVSLDFGGNNHVSNGQNVSFKEPVDLRRIPAHVSWSKLPMRVMVVALAPLMGSFTYESPSKTGSFERFEGYPFFFFLFFSRRTLLQKKGKRSTTGGPREHKQTRCQMRGFETRGHHRCNAISSQALSPKAKSSKVRVSLSLFWLVPLFG